MKDKFKVVGFLARSHGLNALNALIHSDRFEPVYVFTHRCNPNSEDPIRSERVDFNDYERITRQYEIPIHTVDSKKEARKMNEILQEINFDLITCVSWRRLILPDVLSLPKYGGVNLHRGKLPEYAGAEPIKQALQKKETEICITSHVLEEEIDSGRVISVARHPVNYEGAVSFYCNIERLKRELTPYFGPLLLQSLDKLLEEHE